MILMSCHCCMKTPKLPLHTKLIDISNFQEWLKISRDRSFGALICHHWVGDGLSVIVPTVSPHSVRRISAWRRGSDKFDNRPGDINEILNRLSDWRPKSMPMGF